MVKEILEFNPGLCKTECMRLLRCSFIIVTALTLGACFSKKEKKLSPVEDSQIQAPVSAPQPVQKKKEDAESKDKSLAVLTRYFAQADGIHREAWWVLTAEKKPVGKSPFGKVERALLSSENLKLTNKSLFRCDRYQVTRKVSGPSGFPQSAEIFEKCSEKLQGKKIAEFTATSRTDLSVSFFPENLEEILGLGPTILNKRIDCTIKGSDTGIINSLQCKNWNEDHTKIQMIRLDVYDYEREGKNMIKLRGKVFENLSDKRKIEADVPMTGKITVTETELYGPEPTPLPTPVKSAKAGKKGAPDTPAVDPDITKSRGQAPPLKLNEEGWPVDANGNVIMPSEEFLRQRELEEEELRRKAESGGNPGVLSAPPGMEVPGTVGPDGVIQVPAAIQQQQQQLLQQQEQIQPPSVEGAQPNAVEQQQGPQPQQTQPVEQMEPQSEIQDQPAAEPVAPIPVSPNTPQDQGAPRGR